MDWKFWKGDDDPLADLDADFDTSSFDAPGTGAPDVSQDFSAPQQEPRFSPPPSQQVPPDQPSAQGSGGRDLHMELVLSKLDAIRGQLENLSARVERVEARLSSREEQGGSQKQGRGPWYAQD